MGLGGPYMYVYVHIASLRTLTCTCTWLCKYVVHKLQFAWWKLLWSLTCNSQSFLQVKWWQWQSTDSLKATPNSRWSQQTGSWPSNNGGITILWWFSQYKPSSPLLSKVFQLECLRLVKGEGHMHLIDMNEMYHPCSAGWRQERQDLHKLNLCTT